MDAKSNLPTGNTKPTSAKTKPKIKLPPIKLDTKDVIQHFLKQFIKAKCRKAKPRVDYIVSSELKAKFQAWLGTDAGRTFTYEGKPRTWTLTEWRDYVWDRNWHIGYETTVSHNTKALDGYVFKQLSDKERKKVNQKYNDRCEEIDVYIRKLGVSGAQPHIQSLIRRALQNDFDNECEIEEGELSTEEANKEALVSRAIVFSEYTFVHNDRLDAKKKAIGEDKATLHKAFRENNQDIIDYYRVKVQDELNEYYKALDTYNANKKDNVRKGIRSPKCTMDISPIAWIFIERKEANDKKGASAAEDKKLYANQQAAYAMWLRTNGACSKNENHLGQYANLCKGLPVIPPLGVGEVPVVGKQYLNYNQPFKAKEFDVLHNIDLIEVADVKDEPVTTDVKTEEAVEINTKPNKVHSLQHIKAALNYHREEEQELRRNLDANNRAHEQHFEDRDVNVDSKSDVKIEKVVEKLNNPNKEEKQYKTDVKIDTNIDEDLQQRLEKLNNPDKEEEQYIKDVMAQFAEIDSMKQSEESLEKRLKALEIPTKPRLISKRKQLVSITVGSSSTGLSKASSMKF